MTCLWFARDSVSISRSFQSSSFLRSNDTTKVRDFIHCDAIDDEKFVVSAIAVGLFIDLSSRKKKRKAKELKKRHQQSRGPCGKYQDAFQNLRAEMTNPKATKEFSKNGRYRLLGTSAEVYSIHIQEGCQKIAFTVLNFREGSKLKSSFDMVLTLSNLVKFPLKCDVWFSR